MFVYIAGPVRSIGREVAVSIRRPYVDALSGVGITSFDPPGAWHAGDTDRETEDRLQSMNDEVLRRCDVLLVVWLDVVSIGTEHEVKLAIKNRTPVLLTGFGRTFEEYSARVAKVATILGIPTGRVVSLHEGDRVEGVVSMLSDWVNWYERGGGVCDGKQDD